MKRRVTHSLKVTCPTWDHVESFYAHKVKDGDALSARVPFHPWPGEVITLELGLPDQLVIAIDAVVEEAAPAGDGKKSAVRLRLVGLTTKLRARLAALVAEARQGRDRDRARARADSESGGAERRRSVSSAPTPVVATPAEEPPPPPLPTDAPVDELVAPLVLPAAAEVPAGVRPVFEELEQELNRMRGGAAHEVLGVEWDAEVDEIRRAYSGLTKRLHPDVLARYRSSEVQAIASEVFIEVNRAYDRMRDAAVARGGAIAAGPDLLPHRGWLAGRQDIGDGGAMGEVGVAPAATPTAIGSPPPALTSDGLFGDLRTPVPTVSSASAPDSPGGADPESGGRAARATGAPPPRPVEQVMSDARVLIAEREWAHAREILAESLRRDPRNREVRALYHLASAEALLADGKRVDARTQLEVSLAHDPDLTEARAAMERMRKQDRASKAGSLLRRLFK